MNFIATNTGENERVDIVGHSMGGLIALSLGQEKSVSSIVTIATPLGGLDINLLQSYLSRSHFLSEIANNSKFIRQLHSQKISTPTLHLVTTHGFNPYIYEPNDGVVTVRSQMRWKCGEVHEIHANHSEVLLHEDTVNHIKNWLG